MSVIGSYVESFFLMFALWGSPSVVRFGVAPPFHQLSPHLTNSIRYCKYLYIL